MEFIEWEKVMTLGALSDENEISFSFSSLLPAFTSLDICKNNESKFGKYN